MNFLQAITAACSPRFLNKKYTELRPRRAHHTWGCCYVASEALYHLWGKDKGFYSHYLYKGNSVHWFLMNKEGRVLDPTIAQFPNWKPQYNRGIRCGFLTKSPSKRCIELMREVLIVKGLPHVDKFHTWGISHVPIPT